MAEALQFWVGDTATGGGTFPSPLQKINKIISASVNLQLNNGGNVSITIDRRNEAQATIWNLVRPLQYAIYVYRNGYLVWSGPIWTVEEDADSQKITVNAVGWFELLNHRLIRSQPGYVLTTSPITWANGTYESAVSGFSVSRTTATRDTVVFRSGAGSLLISEDKIGPFGLVIQDGNNSIAGTSGGYTTHLPLSATPTAGKRYKLNFYARARKRPGDMGCSIPFLEVLESTTRVALVDFAPCYLTLSYLNNYSNHGFGATTILVPNAGISVGSFVPFSVEWVSSGVNPTFKWQALFNPTQLLDGSCDIANTNWTASGNTAVTVNPGFWTDIFDTAPTGAGGSIYAINQGWNGTFVNGRVYKLVIQCADDGGTTSPIGGTIEIRDNAHTGTLLGSVSLSGIATSGVGFSTISFNWTATSLQPALVVNASWSGSTFANLIINSIIVQENANDTDPIINIDDVTLQEYAGDGIYSNMDAGSIAQALLGKTNSDNNSRITSGTTQVTQPRTRTYQQFSNVGKEIKALSDIESGYDFVIDPITKSLNIYNRTNATNFPTVSSSGQAGAGSWVYSANRSNALRFEYGIGSDNLQTVRKTQDSSSVVNRLNVKGKYALGFAQDTTAQTTYGLFEDLISLPDVIDASTSVLPFYANAEIAFRKNPKILYDIQTKAGGPKLFVDFNIGDRATINIGATVLASSLGQVITQQIRIFGVQMSVDAEGNERLSGIQLSA